MFHEKLKKKTELMFYEKNSFRVHYITHTRCYIAKINAMCEIDI